MANNDLIGFIPVRGGSKEIPGKNIKSLAGRPLICYTIDAALESSYISRLYISTDSAEIEDVVRKHYPGESKLEIFHRDPETASDVASTESAMLDFASKVDFHYIALIQATSPLLKAKDIDGGFEKYLSEKLGGIVSVVNQKRFIWDSSNPLNYNPEERPRRQSFDGFFVENGAFYMTSRQLLLESECRISQPYGIWEMSQHTYFELDSREDWEILESILGNKLLQQAKSPSQVRNIKLLLTDVDGVLTDSGMYYSAKGDELKKFTTRDGKGIELLRNSGLKLGIITSENTSIVEARAKKLKMDFLFQGVEDKLSVVNELMEKEGYKLEELAYIGDDLNDLELIKKAGLSACPSDAVEVIKLNADYICKARGGKGCVREFAELILSGLLQ